MKPGRQTIDAAIIDHGGPGKTRAEGEHTGGRLTTTLNYNKKANSEKAWAGKGGEEQGSSVKKGVHGSHTASGGHFTTDGQEPH